MGFIVINITGTYDECLSRPYVPCTIASINCNSVACPNFILRYQNSGN